MTNPIQPMQLTLSPACTHVNGTDEKLYSLYICLECYFASSCSYDKATAASLKKKGESWKGDLNQTLEKTNVIRKCFFCMNTLRDYWDFYTKDTLNHQKKYDLQLLFAYQKQLSEFDGQTALDLAAGCGTTTRFLLRNGWHTTAIDISPTATDYLEEKLTRWMRLTKLTVLTLDVNAYDFPTSTFDLVVAHDFLSYCNPATLLSFLCKINWTLKENGAFFGNFHMTPSRPYLEQALIDRGAWFVDDEEMVSTILESSGFTCMETRTYQKDEPYIEFYAIIT